MKRFEVRDGIETDGCRLKDGHQEGEEQLLIGKRDAGLCCRPRAS